MNNFLTALCNEAQATNRGVAGLALEIAPEEANAMLWRYSDMLDNPDELADSCALLAGGSYEAFLVRECLVRMEDLCLKTWAEKMGVEALDELVAILDNHICDNRIHLCDGLNLSVKDLKQLRDELKSSV